jgi:hypothetical protein
VNPDSAHAANYGLDGLWTLIDQVPKERRPHLVRGDCAYGQEACVVAAESRERGYLFNVRRTARARPVMNKIERTPENPRQAAGQDRQRTAATLLLSGWSRRRRIVVLRRRLRTAHSPRGRRQWAR